MTDSLSSTLTPVELVERAVQLIRGARRALAFTGAGISTPSGIPDFRSPDSGLWTHANPLEVASIAGFRQNPELFYKWIHPLAAQIHRAKPNAAHNALTRMETAGHIRGIITQNIDGLHTRSGSRVVFELHGHLREATCIHCFRVYPAEPFIRKYLRDSQIPRCERCGNVLKPNVILFGEQLPVEPWLAARSAVRQADLILVVGSSLVVAPACDLPVLAANNGAKLILLNRESTPVDALADVVIHADAARVLPRIRRRLEAST